MKEVLEQAPLHLRAFGRDRRLILVRLCCEYLGMTSSLDGKAAPARSLADGGNSGVAREQSTKWEKKGRTGCSRVAVIESLRSSELMVGFPLERVLDVKVQYG